MNIPSTSGTPISDGETVDEGQGNTEETMNNSTTSDEEDWVQNFRTKKITNENQDQEESNSDQSQPLIVLGTEINEGNLKWSQLLYI